MSPRSRILERYRNVLVAVPPSGADVCRVCWRDTKRHPYCWQCHQQLQEHGSLLADVVVPIALADQSRQFAHELRQYKDGRDDVRRGLYVGLTAVLAEFLRLHEQCLAAAADVGGFDRVTYVPSTGGRQPHPLARMLGEAILQTKPRFARAMEPVEGVPTDRIVRPERFTAREDVTGLNMLVVDDVWTTGSRMQSASIALKNAGAANVIGLVLGRWFADDYPPAKAYLRSAKAEPFDWDRCCLGRSGRGHC
ncbi:phosphoribosyltransferase [Kibdelosporangium phytohabitans]|uniref:Uncharacterized protein n=1 Tax=Kibdelosporangium phytohabitans TaxID=860235 RepID=A0A0N9I311_9PSEU|nr:phosphoribosyltransferase [Kibdelosporangium phytohabitans]ALG14371.1 hypothetical protein AOZ06_52585 [Kibdelosporangium phytohabitans]MBE1466596.1 hypothetical protein [Kibdelosporangium phytohabitans]